jgi:hypothetical protein
MTLNYLGIKVRRETRNLLNAIAPRIGMPFRMDQIRGHPTSDSNQGHGTGIDKSAPFDRSGMVAA